MNQTDPIEPPHGDMIDNLSPAPRRFVENGDANTIHALIVAYGGLSSRRLIELATTEGLTLSTVKAGMTLLSREGWVYQSRLGIWYSYLH